MQEKITTLAKCVGSREYVTPHETRRQHACLSRKFDKQRYCIACGQVVNQLSIPIASCNKIVALVQTKRIQASRAPPGPFRRLLLASKASYHL